MLRPVIVAPAMNTHMWDHPVTASQLDTIRQWGYTVLEPQVRFTAGCCWGGGGEGEGG
jgi:phosphopantothenoylcysteine synthetase/decarboxylase